MSIHSIVLHFLLAADKQEKLRGTFLSVGRQTVLVDPTRLAAILAAYGARMPAADLRHADATDSRTRNTAGGVRDDVLFSFFSDVDYKCLDKSDYEGADGELDLNAPSIPDRHRGRYDFIYDGGTLDNVFSPAQAVRNLAGMLAVGGRVLHFDVAGAWPGAYCSFSCEWFFSFYAANNFDDVQVFLAIPLGSDSWPDPRFRLFSYSPFFTRRRGYDPLAVTRTAIPVGAFVLCTARRTDRSTVSQIPTQSHYLEPGELDWRQKFLKYSGAPSLPLRFDDDRMPTVGESRPDGAPPFCSDHYSLMGVL